MRSIEFLSRKVAMGRVLRGTSREPTCVGRIRGSERIVHRRHAALGLRTPLRLGLYTGMRHSEVLGLRWGRLDLDAMTLVVEKTKSGEPLEIPIVRQVAAILERRIAERGRLPENSRVRVFPSGPARRVGSPACSSTMRVSARRAVRSSGSMRCATASLRWRTGS